MTNQLDLPVWILWLAVVLWTLGFDTVYAMPDREDDRRLGVNSAALFFGDFTPRFVGFCFLGTWLLLIWLGLLRLLAWPFWITLATRPHYLVSAVLFAQPLQSPAKAVRANFFARMCCWGL